MAISIKGFNNLPFKAKQRVLLGITVFFLATLPLFIWAIITQRFELRKRAATGEPVCVRNTPSLSFIHSRKVGTPGLGIVYRFTLENLDTQACGPTIFNIGFNTPSNWSSSIINQSTNAFSVEPNVATSFGVEVTSTKENYFLGDQPVTVTVNTLQGPIHSMSATTIYELVETLPLPMPSELCYQECSFDHQCADEGLTCIEGYCTNLICNTSSNCMCDGPSQTPVLVTPTPTPTPIASPIPTPIACGLEGYSTRDSCNKDNTRFRYVDFSCKNGVSGSMGGPTSCKSKATWKKYVSSACLAQCEPETPIPSPLPPGPTLTPFPGSPTPSPTPTTSTPTPTPPGTGVPTPGPTSNNAPVIQTNKFRRAKQFKLTRIRVSGTDKDKSDVLDMTFKNLPSGLIAGECSQRPSRRSVGIRCNIEGIPFESGVFVITATLTDGKDTVTKDFTLTVKPVKKYQRLIPYFLGFFGK